MKEPRHIAVKDKNLITSGRDQYKHCSCCQTCTKEAIKPNQEDRYPHKITFANTQD